ncbi:MAG: hypothetical protein M3R31_00280 [Pseudomonadota bacterium]|nr:hypothetical protein [Pseudomonadota bacterium]
MQELQLGGEIGLVEDEHVERIARAIQVAGFPAQRQCGVGRLHRLGGPTLTVARDRDYPLRTPLIGAPPERVKQFGGPHAIARGFFKIHPIPELRFGEPKQAHRFQRNLFALARRLQRGGGGGDRRLDLTLSYLHQGKAVPCLCLECGGLGALRKLEHRVRVGAGALQVALGDEAFRAQVEEVEAASNAQAGHGHRRRGQLDGPRMLAGPRQVANPFRGWGGISRAGLRCALPSRIPSFMRIRHQLLEVSIPPRY